MPIPLVWATNTVSNSKVVKKQEAGDKRPLFFYLLKPYFFRRAMMLHRFFILMIAALLSVTAYALDTGNESMADKADRFKFEDFHKEKGITLWEEKKDTKELSADSTATANAASGTQAFEKGQTLKVREAYKLGNDPALRTLPGLFDAIEALHKQLNSKCPKGWIKEQEWHKPADNAFYIYYQATCL
jgi:hypothetical protein